jgi:hypothetical protein
MIWCMSWHSGTPIVEEETKQGNETSDSNDMIKSMRDIFEMKTSNWFANYSNCVITKLTPKERISSEYNLNTGTDHAAHFGHILTRT